MTLEESYIKQKLLHLAGTTARNLFLLLPVFVVLLIELCIAYLSNLVDAPRISVVPFVKESETKTIFLNTLFFVSIVSLGIVFIYVTLKRGMTHLLEKMFGIGGGLLTLSLGGFFSLHLYRLFSSLLVFFFVWLCELFIALSMAFTVIGVFSEETRNLVYLVYSSVAGSFLALGIPMFSMIYIILSVCIIDLVSYRVGILGKIDRSI